MDGRLVNLNFPVREEKIAELNQRFEALDLKESDFEETFVKGSGKGGQKVNKSNNCVVLKHLETGIVVKCHKERTLILNRFFARRLLCESLEKENGLASNQDQKIQRKIKNKLRKKKKAKSKLLEKPNEEPMEN